jgi:hypothetical protein
LSKWCGSIPTLASKTCWPGATPYPGESKPWSAARPRGPARYDSIGGTVEVILECDIYGETGIEYALMPPAAAGPPAGEPVAASLSDAARAFLREYSGLAFDGTGAGLKPSLFPRVYDERGKLLLDPRAHLESSGAPGAYAVQYVGTPGGIYARPEFDRPPLVLKVRQAGGKLGADIVLGGPDADRLEEVRDALLLLIDTGRVLVKLQ